MIASILAFKMLPGIMRLASINTPSGIEAIFYVSNTSLKISILNGFDCVTERGIVNDVYSSRPVGTAPSEFMS